MSSSIKFLEPRLVRVAVTVSEREHLSLIRLIARLRRRYGWREARERVRIAFDAVGDRVQISDRS